MNRRRFRLLLLLMVAAIGALTSYSLRETRTMQTWTPTKMVGQAQPEFSLFNLQGEMISSSSWAGKVTLINFWASWCPPCRREIPDFAEVHEFYQDQGFEVVGIAVDRKKDVKDFLSKIPQVQYTQLVGSDDAAAVGRRLGNDSGSLPYSVLVDRKGLIRFVKQGELRKTQLLEAVEPLLAEKQTQ